MAGGLPGLAGKKKSAASTKHAAAPSDTDQGSTTGHDSGSSSKTVAHAFPWPVAEKSHKWSNFRKGAYSIPAVAPAAVAVATTTATSSFPWPVAEKPRTWSNFRKGAYSIPAVAVVAKTAAGSFPWPIADKPRKWSNFRVVEKRKKVVVKVAGSKTVAHPFPWPVADKPRKWNNVRKATARKKIVVKVSGSKTVAHPFPWPVADKPRKWTNFRAAPGRSKVTGVAHAFPWPVAKKPRKWTNFRAAPKRAKAKGVAHAFPWPVAKKPRKWTNFRAAPRRKASDCRAELNRVARNGVILFETASAKLTRSSYATLDRLAGVARTCDRVSIVVEGHTDDRGSAAFNQRLSERRAQSVAAYLKGAGIASSSLSAVGYGESRPAVPNTSASNMAKNRRIEFSASGR